eukprot:jgi/Phyca11/108254/e_gw1.15.759.1
MDETNFNLWSTRTRGRSRRGQRAVKKYLNSNEFIRATLRKFENLDNVVLVLGNAPCHARAEHVFEEPEFAGATLLRLGPYSPMLNPIENVFSAFKSAVKDYMTEHRADILAVPEGVTMKAHRHFHLTRAARSKFPEVATPGLCEACYRHTLTFHVKVTDLEDMPVGR